MNRIVLSLAGVLVLLGALVLSLVALGQPRRAAESGPLAVKSLRVERGLTEIEKSCIECHSRNEPGKVHDWARSLHARANVTCLDCHRAQPTDKDALDCPGTVKYPDVKISPIVSPADCSRCHPREAEQFARSKHARTWEIQAVQIKDPWMRGMNSGVERSVGCEVCHGSDLSAGKLDPSNWPNVGCGRINPDGSKGSCVMCHTGHRFSIAEARKPETCGQCHLGPDHPQEEIYFESKHGKRYLAEGRTWDFEAAPDTWEPGVHFSAPTCAVCHMAGVGALSTTHDVGERLKWEAQAPFSVLNKDHDGEAERKKMLTVCTQCHSPRWAGNYLARYDQANEHYNEEYFVPVKAMMDELYAKGLLSRWPIFDEEIEWTFYELWHHEGRRARMGSAMMGPDYSWWHGFYDLKKSFGHFVRQFEEVKAKGHGSPVYVPGSGTPNLTPAQQTDLPAAWDSVPHLLGRPAAPAKP